MYLLTKFMVENKANQFNVIYSIFTTIPYKTIIPNFKFQNNDI